MEVFVHFFRDTLSGPVYVIVVIIAIILIFACIGYLAENKIKEKKQKEKYAEVAGPGEVVKSVEATAPIPVVSAGATPVNEVPVTQPVAVEQSVQQPVQQVVVQPVEEIKTVPVETVKTVATPVQAVQTVVQPVTNNVQEAKPVVQPVPTTVQTQPVSTNVVAVKEPLPTIQAVVTNQAPVVQEVIAQPQQPVATSKPVEPLKINPIPQVIVENNTTVQPVKEQAN